MREVSFAMLFARLLDIPGAVFSRVTGKMPDYREHLFKELVSHLHGQVPQRVLEIGPRDGEDTKKLLTLPPEELVLVDLPDKEERVRSWLPALNSRAIKLIIGNIMYDETCESLRAFDVVWCTGVLYHNPEQLRMVRRLYDLVRPGGVLVIESATARRGRLRNENCVELWHGESKALHRRHHVSQNITHLPSRHAIRSWLEIVGFEYIEQSGCHRAVSRSLAANRAAFIARRPLEDASRGYYAAAGLNYDIGKAR